MEKSLAQIAREAYWNTMSENQDTFDGVAKAVEAEVLSRLKKSEVEPVAGQELTFVQVAQWVEKHGSTNGLQWRDGSGKWWKDEDVTTIYASAKYRVAPKKIMTTWVEGTFVLVRNSVSLPWLMGTFIKQIAPDRVDVMVGSERISYIHAKLATPEQIEAWKLINEEPQ